MTVAGSTEKKARRPKARALKPLERHDKLAGKFERRLNTLARRAFRLIKAGLLDRLDATTQKDAADDAAERLRRFLAGLSDEDFAWPEELEDEIRDLMADLASAYAERELERLSAATATSVEQANARAVEWAKHQAGNLITDVSEATRDGVNQLTARAIEDGLSAQEYADVLGEAWEFSADRSLMIARTELAFAETQGTLVGYAASGVVEKKGWSADAEACDECDAMNGEEVALEESFSDGSDGPPAHPNCRCTTYPVASLESEDEA